MTLDEWLIEKRMTEKAFAEVTGISPPQINKLRRRVTKPSADSAMVIFDVTHGRCPLPDLMPLPQEASAEELEQDAPVNNAGGCGAALAVVRAPLC